MKHLWDIIRSTYLWIVGGLTVFMAVVWMMIRFKLNPAYDVHPFFMKLSPFLTRLSGIDLTIEGQENIDPDQSYIVTFNHLNFFDHFVLYQALGKPLTGLEKENHMKWPVYGSFMKSAGIIPIPPRGHTERAMEGIERAKEKLQEGKSILIAPEGTRCREGKLGPFKKGGIYMAIQTQTPILPMVYDAGMYRFNQRASFFLRPGPVTLTILPPIPTQNCTPTDANDLRDQLRGLYTERIGETYVK